MTSFRRTPDGSFAGGIIEWLFYKVMVMSVELNALVIGGIQGDLIPKTAKANVQIPEHSGAIS
jgi:hypothetical protein